MNCSRQKKKKPYAAQARKEKGNHNLILNFHFKRKSRKKEKKVLQRINNKLLKFLLLVPSVNSYFLNVICFSDSRAYYSRSMRSNILSFCCVCLKWKFSGPQTSLTSLGQKVCTDSNRERRFPPAKKNDFVVYNRKWGRKRKLYLPFSELHSDSKES